MTLNVDVHWPGRRARRTYFSVWSSRRLRVCHAVRMSCGMIGDARRHSASDTVAATFAAALDRGIDRARFACGQVLTRLQRRLRAVADDRLDTDSPEMLDYHRRMARVDGNFTTSEAMHALLDEIEHGRVPA